MARRAARRRRRWSSSSPSSASTRRRAGSPSRAMARWRSVANGRRRRSMPATGSRSSGRVKVGDRMTDIADDKLVIAGTELSSRLFVGTGGYPNQRLMLDAIAASGAALVTVSIRRISLDAYGGSLVDALGDRYKLLPNTAGCATARDAVLTAELAREALER